MKKVPQCKEIELWKSLWKLWITHCKKMLLKKLCKYAEEKRETSGKVEKSVIMRGFCQFFDKKTGAHSVGKRNNRESFVGLFCKKGSKNTICIIAANAVVFQGSQRLR